MSAGMLVRGLLPCAGLLATSIALAGNLPDACAARSKGFMDALIQGDYAGARKDFNADMQAAASADALRQVWAQVQVASGSFRSRGEAESMASTAGAIVLTPIHFADAEQVFEVSCAADGAINGIHVLSPAKAAEISARAATPATRPARAPVEARTMADGTRVEPVAVPSPWGPLRGALTLPAGSGPFPAVVLVAGSGPNDMDETVGPDKPFRDIADGLARAGVASLRYDKRTRAYASQSVATPGFSVDDEVTDDALSALRLLADRQAIDPHRLFVLGHSLGGMMAPRIAQRDRTVAGVVMLAAPARPMLDVLAEQFRRLGKLQGASPVQIDALEQGIDKERALLQKADPAHPPQGMSTVIPQAPVPQSYPWSLYRYHQVAVAQSLALPMLILQGGNDIQVSPERDFGLWKQALAGRHDVTFRMFPGLGHLFMPVPSGLPAGHARPAHVDPGVIAVIATWIKRQPAAK